MPHVAAGFVTLLGWKVTKGFDVSDAPRDGADTRTCRRRGIGRPYMQQMGVLSRFSWRESPERVGYICRFANEANGLDHRYAARTAAIVEIQNGASVCFLAVLLRSI